MILLAKLISITSILVLGYTIVTQEGMALYSIREWAMRKKEEGKKWAEPLFICHWCQPSSWSLISFGFSFGLGIINRFEWNLVFYYILTVGGSSLLNGLVWGYHLKTDAQTDFYKSASETAETITESFYKEPEEYEEYFEPQHN